MPPLINPGLCTRCGVCQDVCPGDILHLDGGVAGMVRYGAECSHCDVCRVECPAGAITIQFPWHMRQHPVSLELRPGTNTSHA